MSSQEAVETGQVWKFKNITKRPNVEIVRYDKYSEIVYMCYVGTRNSFDMNLDQFLKDFERI